MALQRIARVLSKQARVPSGTILEVFLGFVKLFSSGVNLKNLIMALRLNTEQEIDAGIEAARKCIEAFDSPWPLALSCLLHVGGCIEKSYLSTTACSMESQRSCESSEKGKTVA